MFTTKKLVLLLLVIFSYSYGGLIPPLQLPDLLNLFKNGNYSFEVGQTLAAYDSVKSEEHTYRVHKIDGYNDCLGVTTDAFETVVLQCPQTQQKKPGCFEIFTPNEISNKTVISVRETRNSSCIRVILDKCVAVETPLKWMIILNCTDSSLFETHYQFDVRNNGRPPPRG